jgi:putative DNA primase/helicase
MTDTLAYLAATNSYVPVEEEDEDPARLLPLEAPIYVDPEPTLDPAEPKLPASTRNGDGPDPVDGGDAAAVDVADHQATDVRNAQRMLALHGPDLRYVPEWTTWMRWDGERWLEDRDGEAERRLKLTLNDLQTRALTVDDDKIRGRLMRDLLASERDGRIRGALRQAQSEPGIPVAPAELDADQWLLNVANGTIDLHTGNLLDHDPAHLLTKLAPVAHDAGAECPCWIAFLEKIFAGNAELIAFVQRLVGYLLTGVTREQLLVILFGLGANGKSTFVRVLEWLLGDYAHQAAADLLMQQNKNRGGATPELAALHGRRFVAAIETEQGRRLNESLVKQLTGGDLITARRLFRDPFTFAPTHKIVLATNHRPEIVGTDHAIWRRLALIPFEVTIPEDEQVDQDVLLARFIGEAPGILNWAIAGCLAWQNDGLQRPDAVAVATRAYRAEMDAIGDFLADKCILRPNAKAKAGELYSLYSYWATSNGVEQVKQRAFGSALAARGLTSTRTSDARWWNGVGIRIEDDA